MRLARYTDMPVKLLRGLSGLTCNYRTIHLNHSTGNIFSLICVCENIYTTNSSQIGIFQKNANLVVNAVILKEC